MSLLLALSRLTIRDLPVTIRSISTSSSLLLRTTPILCAEPLKKKKKLDPQIIKQREERRKKKLEKQIRRLEKNARQLKPVDELEVPLELIDEKAKRARPTTKITPEIAEARAILHKDWARYKLNQKIADFRLIDRLLQSQNKALDELRKESEELYQEAIQPDLNLVPVTVKGPVATPPIKNYNSPDGDYINKSKKWEV